MKLLFGLLILINIAFFLWNSSDRGVDEGQRRQSVHEDQVRLVDEDPGHSRASLDDVIARGVPQINPVSTDAPAAKPTDKPVDQSTVQSTGDNQVAEPGSDTRPAGAPAAKPAVSAKQQTPTAAPPAPQPAASKPAAPDAVAPVEIASKPTPAPAPAVRECRTFGPFKDKSAAKGKVAELKKQDISATIVSSSKSAGIKNRYRVFQGPFSSSGMARARRDSLTRKGIKEHFARKDSSGKYFVSLGVFSTREAADKLVSALGKKGENAKIKTEKITGESVTEYRVKTAACK